MKKIKPATDILVDVVIKGIQEKKGEEIVSLSLKKLENVICNYFIICHADSTTQVKAIAESIQKFVEENLQERVWKKEGFENAQWIILDYADVVVHVFQKPYRDYYRLEELWADADFKQIENI